MANDKIIKGVTTAYLLTLKPNAEFFHRAWPMSDSFRSCVYKSMDLIKLSRRPLIIVAFLLFFAVTGTTCSAADCDEFVSWVAPAKNAYQKTHRIYPVPAIYKDLAVRYMPRIWVPPESWQPIDFDDYLAKSRLVGKYDRKVLIAAPSVRDMIALDYEEQCAVYLETDEVAPRNPAPIYIQAFHDENPADATHQWIYIKYNLVFDWSGLATQISWLSWVGAWLSGGDLGRWHRLDIHLAAILAFDAARQLRMLTLAQHNHQQTFLAGIDFPRNQKPLLVAAVRSNELYLDTTTTPYPPIFPWLISLPWVSGVPETLNCCSS